MSEKVIEKSAGKLYGIAALCFAVAYSIYCFAVMPLYFSLAADVDFANGFLPNAIGYLGLAIENVAIFAFYGIMVYGIYCFGYYGFRGIVGVFCAATVYKYSANMIMSWVRSGAIPSTWIWDIVDVVYYTVLELVMLWIIIAIVRRLIARSREQTPTFGKLYDKTNPLMRSALVCSIVTVCVKVFGNLINDVIFIVEYGVVQYFASCISVILNYLAVLLLGVVCYAVSLFVITRFYSENQDQVQ